MILVTIKGGLGNQIFQYACGRAFAIEQQTTLALDLSWFTGEAANLPEARREYLLDQLNIAPETAIYPAEKAKKINYHFQILNDQTHRIKRRLIRLYEKRNPDFHNWSHIQERTPFKYDPTLLHNAKENILLEGYWQCEAYFSNIRNLLFQEISLKDGFSTDDQTLSMKMQTSQSVCLHIRRGDYVAIPRVNTVHGVLPLEYYTNAVNHINEKLDNPDYYVFSDDPEWCQNNLQLPVPYQLVSFENRNQVQELLLMSHCRHQIIANSSFSWWAAWLNQNEQKIVIGPQQWRNIDDKTPIPDEWTKI